MYAVVIGLVMFTQAEGGLPPAPAPEFSPAPPVQSLEEMKSWLMSRLIVDMAFDTRKSAEVRQLMDTMNEPQMRMLIAAYKEKSLQQEPRPQVSVPPFATDQQLVQEQAKLNQQLAEAYRDHLKREYDRQLLQGFMTQNLVQQNILNNQRALSMSYGPFTYGAAGYAPWGCGGLSYGVVNYGGFAYGAPGFGTVPFYAFP